MDNVVNLKDFRSKKKDSASDEAAIDLAEVAKRNAENDRRVKEERALANKGVIASHRLKKR